ncbi:hypothetical protein [Cohnella massiliensis]|uniref:hypothetical protein n=1 Tax=Cohnella massiliensis TaxID=1816691 RepID=UPI0009B979ED|nr:hypothetical protein [Cohnella massiliensis]
MPRPLRRCAAVESPPQAPLPFPSPNLKAFSAPFQSKTICQTATTEATGTTSGRTKAVCSQRRIAGRESSSRAIRSDAAVSNGTLSPAKSSVLIAARRNEPLSSTSR